MDSAPTYVAAILSGLVSFQISVFLLFDFLTVDFILVFFPLPFIPLIPYSTSINPLPHPTQPPQLTTFGGVEGLSKKEKELMDMEQ